MLHREDAQEQLKALTIPDGFERAKTRIEKLPKDLRVIADELCYSLQYHRSYGQGYDPEKYRVALIDFDGLSPPKQKQIFAAFFPKMADVLTDAWALVIQLGVRQTFRAPRRPDVSLYDRDSWLHSCMWRLAYYDQDICWLAAWAPHIHIGSLGVLLAAALNRQDDTAAEVYDILIASAKGEHPVGGMGRHVVHALLMADNPAGWEFIGKMLVVAQRQEGLRQVILESVRAAQPQAFIYMLQIVIDNKLERFAATVRAINKWFGVNLEAGQDKHIKDVLTKAQHFLTNQDTRRTLLTTDGLTTDALQDVYIALQVEALFDVYDAMLLAKRLLSQACADIRVLAASFLRSTYLKDASELLAPCLEYDDLRTVVIAIEAISRISNSPGRLALSELFEPIEKLVARMPHKVNFEPLVQDWLTIRIGFGNFEIITYLLRALYPRPPERVFQYLDMMSRFHKMHLVNIVKHFAVQDNIQPSDDTRAVLHTFLTGTSTKLRHATCEALQVIALNDQDIVALQKLLRRKDSGLRSDVLGVLLSLSDERVLTSAQQLLEAAKPLQREAGLTLLHELKIAQRGGARLNQLASTYRPATPSAREAALLAPFSQGDFAVPSLDDGFGLFDPAKLSRAAIPKDIRKSGWHFDDPWIVETLQSLDDLVAQYAETPVQVETATQGKYTELLGNVVYFIWSPRKWSEDGGNPISVPNDSDAIALREIWEAWWLTRLEARQDKHHLGVHHIDMFCDWNRERTQSSNDSNIIIQDVWRTAPRYFKMVQNVVEWLARFHSQPEDNDVLLHGFETSLAIAAQYLDAHPELLNDPEELARGLRSYDTADKYAYLRVLLNQARTWHRHAVAVFTHLSDEQMKRLWSLMCCYKDLPQSGEIVRSRWQVQDLMTLVSKGFASEHDVYNFLIGPRKVNGFYRIYGSGDEFAALSRLTSYKPVRVCQDFPQLKTMLARIEKRLLDVELARGDKPTNATRPVSRLSSICGVDVVVEILTKLQGETLSRNYDESSARRDIFSDLLAKSYTAKNDTSDAIQKALQAKAFSEKQLLDFTFYASIWAPLVAQVLAWPGFLDAFYWLLAHNKSIYWSHETKNYQSIYWSHETKNYQPWELAVLSRSPLIPQEFQDGAADVVWFHRAYQAIGKQRWQKLVGSAKYASFGQGHSRAQHFADAILGNLNLADVAKRIKEKRHQDSVRVLGLVPLAKGKKRDDDVLARYQLIQEFLRGSKKFGAQRRASEALAAEIGLQNLARAAGHADAQRFIWAMETAEVADLATGPVVVTEAETSVSLSVDDAGVAHLTVLKKGKTLKNIPAKLKKQPEIVTLRERKTALDKQRVRMRASLENAMIRGDSFTVGELTRLNQHPVLAPMLASLLLVTEAGTLGYWQDGTQLARFDGNQVQLGETSLRIAHPQDLLAAGEWSAWQRDCLEQQRVQPFKQLFRELYILTQAEKDQGVYSHRYEGHQVNPRQAVALLDKRGWVNTYDDGIRRTFHEHGINAWLYFQEGWYTPAEVDGLTLESVHFSLKESYQPLSLEDVPPRIFSEVMRDLDLVVSVAHRGGIDPEASASTIEMRTQLLTETLDLLSLSNVRLEHHHALIKGQLGDYTVHLGSANVHRQPGGAICIIPVHSQQRGRLFLPFADDDPKTAEVVSKVLLLANDQDIKDPTILRQLR
ncbi:MAG: DUF5724 domain-containing protein [Deinococcota bacterium]